MPQIIKRNGELIRINPQDRRTIEYSISGGSYWRECYSSAKYNDSFEFYELTLADNGEEILAETSDGPYYSKNGGRGWGKRDGKEVNWTLVRIGVILFVLFEIFLLVITAK